MTIRLLCCLTALAAATGANLAQETKDGGDPEKPRDAFVKIMNACDTSQNERWRTGLDLKFKDQTIGKDIRLGERGPTGKISFTGRDFIEVFRRGDDSGPLVRVPANLKAGGGTHWWCLVSWMRIPPSSTFGLSRNTPCPRRAIKKTGAECSS